MAKFLGGKDEVALAKARAEYELAKDGLSRVRGDELIADLKYGVSTANSAEALEEAVKDAEELVRRMRRSLTVVRILERQYGAKNQDLVVHDRTQATAFARVSREWEVADSGRVAL